MLIHLLSFICMYVYQVYLRNYEYYFHEQWEKLKKEYIYKQAMSCAQKTGTLTHNNSISDDINCDTNNNITTSTTSNNNSSNKKKKNIFNDKRKNETTIVNIEEIQNIAIKEANSFFSFYYLSKNQYKEHNNTTNTTTTSTIHNNITAEYVDSDLEDTELDRNNKTKRNNFIFTDSENDSDSSSSTSSSNNSSSDNNYNTTSSIISNIDSKYELYDTINTDTMPHTIFSFLNKRKKKDFQRKLKQTVLVPTTSSSSSINAKNSKYYNNTTSTSGGDNNKHICSSSDRTGSNYCHNTIKPNSYHQTNVKNPNIVSISPTPIATMNSVYSSNNSHTNNTSNSNSSTIDKYKINNNSIIKKSDREILLQYHIKQKQQQIEAERVNMDLERVNMGFNKGLERVNLGVERVKVNLGVERVIPKEIVRTMVENEITSDSNNNSSNNDNNMNAYDLYFNTRTCMKKKDKKYSSSSGSRDTCSTGVYLQEPNHTTTSTTTTTNPTPTTTTANTITPTPMTTTSTNPHILRTHKHHTTTATIAQQHRLDTRRGATQALDIEYMHTADAQSIYTQDQQQYRNLMNIAGNHYIQQYVSQQYAPDMNISYINNDNHTDTKLLSNLIINKQLYFASKEQLYNHKPTISTLSPIQLTEELNKTQNNDSEISIKPKLLYRNDEGFNARAAELAGKLDISELFSTFDPAKYSIERDIVVNSSTDNNSSSTGNNDNSGSSIDIHSQQEQQQLSEQIQTITTTTSHSPTTTTTIAQQSYIDYMKAIYDEEMNTMLNNLITHLPHKLANKVRLALQKKQEKMKLEKRKKYIQRRRKLEIIKIKEINELKEYYEKQQYIINNDSDSSSSDNENNNKKERKNDLTILLGEQLNNIDTEHMSNIIITRALEEEEIQRKLELLKQK